MGSRGAIQVIHNDLGRSKDLITAAVTTLRNLKNNMIRLEWIMPHRNSFVLVRIKGQASGFDGLDAVAAEQSAQLLQRNSHPLAQWIRVSGMLASQGSFKIVESGQQVSNKCFFLRRGMSLGISLGARFKVSEVGRKEQVVILLCGQLPLELDWVRRRKISDSPGRILRIGHCVLYWLQGLHYSSL